jgi:hypothetical protein
MEDEMERSYFKHGEMRNAYKILTRNAGWKRSPEEARHTREGNESYTSGVGVRIGFIWLTVGAGGDLLQTQ